MAEADLPDSYGMWVVWFLAGALVGALAMCGVVLYWMIRADAYNMVVTIQALRDKLPQG